MSQVETLERNVACPVPVVLFLLSDERYAFCNVASDGWLNVERLGIDERQHQNAREKRVAHTSFASRSAPSQSSKRVLTSARPASAW